MHFMQWVCVCAPIKMHKGKKKSVQRKKGEKEETETESARSTRHTERARQHQIHPAIPYVFFAQKKASESEQELVPLGALFSET